MLGFSCIPALKSQGQLITNPRLKAEVLNNQFKQAFSEGREYSSDEFTSRCQIPSKLEDYMFMAEITIFAPGIEKLLMNLKSTKAAGPDSITPLVLHELTKEIVPILTTIYRSSLKTGVIPSDWNKALVTPVFKRGQHYNAANYRPISLISIPCKILKHMLVGVIIDHLESNNILCPQLHGFHRYRSCEMQLLEFIEEVSAAMESGMPTDVIIMDFA